MMALIIGGSFSVKVCIASSPSCPPMLFSLYYSLDRDFATLKGTEDITVKPGSGYTAGMLFRHGICRKTSVSIGLLYRSSSYTVNGLHFLSNLNSGSGEFVNNSANIHYSVIDVHLLFNN
jgi:hypothetical protein